MDVASESPLMCGRARECIPAQEGWVTIGKSALSPRGLTISRNDKISRYLPDTFDEHTRRRIAVSLHPMLGLHFDPKLKRAIEHGLMQVCAVDDIERRFKLLLEVRDKLGVGDLESVFPSAERDSFWLDYMWLQIWT